MDSQDHCVFLHPNKPTYSKDCSTSDSDSDSSGSGGIKWVSPIKVESMQDEGNSYPNNCDSLGGIHKDQLSLKFKREPISYKSDSSSTASNDICDSNSPSLFSDPSS